MKRRIQEYMARMDNIIEADEKETDWQALKQEHLEQISFYQHERLVHLLVMMLMVILMMMTIAIAMIADYIPMYAVTLACLVLVIPYINHYYFLENSVQMMYEQYDKILTLLRRDTTEINAMG